MRKVAISLVLAGLLFLPLHLHGQSSDNDINAILTAAEGLFKAMHRKDYPGIWAFLSEKSRDTVVADTYKEMIPSSYTKMSVSEDFTRGGVLSKAYWDAYLEHFNPILALEESRWEMGPAKGDRAEILITYKKAQKPATLFMFREDSKWRVGLIESFWARK